MSIRKDVKGRHFTIFRSAREEADDKSVETGPANEGGHMSCIAGRIVSTSGAQSPFKAVMTLEDGGTFERGFATMGEAEAYIRRNTPRPSARSTTYDHSAP